MRSEIRTNRNRITSRGFSLIELLVSVFIFSIVMTISMGSLLILIDANEKGQGIQAVMTNLSFALDSMTRDMRTGYDYYCGTVEDNPGDTLPRDDDATPQANEATQDCAQKDYVVFVDNRTGERTGFRHNAPSDDDPIGSIQRNIEGEGWLDVTAPELSVTKFLVTVEGSTEGDEIQPTAQFFVEGYIVNESDTDPDFHLQTHITQRTLDF